MSKGRVMRGLVDAGAQVRHASFHPNSSTCGVWTSRYLKMKSLSEKGGTFAFVGKRGGGKSQLSVSLMGHHLYNLKKSVRYLKLIDFIDGMNDEGRQSFISEMYKAHLLVIDAIEERGGNMYEPSDLSRTKSNLNYIIDKRYGDPSKVTILCSNDTKASLKELLTASVSSRMSEHGGWLTFEGTNFRVEG